MSNEDKIISLLEIVVSKVDNLEYKVDNLEYKFDNLEFKMDGIDYKVDSVDKRLEKAEPFQKQMRDEIFALIESSEERVSKLHERHLSAVLENIARVETRLLKAVGSEVIGFVE